MLGKNTAMGRRNRRQVTEQRELRATSNQTIELWQGVSYVVRQLNGSGSTKTYRCPGCDHEVRPATAHVVVWPEGDEDADHRRHWHKVCWQHRDNRRVTQHRGGAPRF